ncbi:MAG TPA: pyruvate dehydrogenase (acetyl-transferring) E1 component subunit alpha, partial [Alphaproteobacteria bacterium]|nr:pyruvate dehydrogenase (acetyl-transferring) E1 component subunit alpha [Alphaproteobacteria bacterium]
ELESMKQDRDPLTAIKDAMQAAGVPEEDIKLIDKDVKDVVNDSAQFAQDSPLPDESELWTDVLIETE